MFGQHPESDAELHYDFGCTWYSDHGPYYSALQFAWFLFGLPCMVLTTLALLSTCGLACTCRRPHRQIDTSAAIGFSSIHYGPLIDAADVKLDVDVDRDVHQWVHRGAFGAILYGVMLAILGVFIALHSNNEAEFTFLVDAFAALVMCASKVVVALCARAVHRNLSPISRQIAKEWTLVLAFSKALTAGCALVLVLVYLGLAIGGVDANRGDGTRRMQRYNNVSQENDDPLDDIQHGPTTEEKAQICAAGFFMVWSFLLSLVSQSVAGFAFFRIYANAVHVYGDPQIFRKVVDFWWAVIVGGTCGVGIALWLGSAICLFPALDISPLRMMGLFYFIAAGCQLLAGYAMIGGNAYIRAYYEKRSAGASSLIPATVMGNTDGGKPTDSRQMQIIVPEGACPGMTMQAPTPQGSTLKVIVPEGTAPGVTLVVHY